MRRKTAEMGERREVIYDEARWKLLEEKRARAIEVLGLLEACQLDGFVFGSVARGDVRPASDIDIFIPAVVSSVTVSLCMEPAGILGVSIVQATPRALVKANVELEDNTTVTFPLISPREVELEFYRFGGSADLARLRKGERSPGVDKRLMLIEPTPAGHIETPLSDLSPGTVARKLKVGQQIVEERLRVLERRADVGRTGVYLKRPLAPGETPEQVLHDLMVEDPAIRRRVESG
ncbi:nucleotidyltransferase domain-containing protein [Methanocella arvoryzae]|uniref:Predicted nucleotidyltransferase n=1 Tax=Methanocella arvoryzae (strain DSM 22066 / NBRC 105507 / MRE50) TaxID=351160 RepID=Q0W670_METAR|nr:nucleotidyltransferase domain-containing protein [Methanocella arvoryzae]CAH04863.1 predicted nucleotidyl transferase [uncultured archaeon]CAJ36123.1 predicted nucleotidyltransferase [Methanocella arvoryzae MRE50]